MPAFIFSACYNVLLKNRRMIFINDSSLFCRTPQLPLMQKSAWLKGITLVSSVSLVTLFLMYRSGSFYPVAERDTATLQASPNGGVVQSNNTDSTPPVKDPREALRMSSSKLLILTDGTNRFIDSIIKASEKPIKLSKKDLKLLSSSKSAAVFSTDDTGFRLYTDSLRLKLNYDSMIPKKKRKP